MDLEQLYLRLPTRLQNVVVSAQGYRIQRSRYGGAFQDQLAGYESRSSWDRERIIEYRDRRLQAFVRHAVETVPYYRDLFSRLNLTADDIRRLEDLEQLPVLTKQTVQEQVARFRSEAYRGQSLQMHHTSGSTGAGLQFPVTLESQHEQWGVWWRYRRWHGLHRNEWCLYFGGRSVVPLSQRRPPYWRTNRPGRQLMFSAYHLSDQTIADYLAEMKRSGARWIHGYPSVVTFVAEQALRLGVKLPIRWITTGAESLLPHQKQIVRRAFGVSPIEHYGMAEGVANISECPHGGLHVDEDYAAVEFLPGTSGAARVIGTNFTNPAFPLLRYDVGDLATPSSDVCPCGRPGRLVECIDGRQEDCVVTRSGCRLGRLDHIFKDCVRVREAQIRQNQPGHVTIWIVTAEGYGRADEEALTREIVKRVGDDLTFEIEHVDSIPRTRSGKLRFVVSNLSAEAA